MPNPEFVRHWTLDPTITFLNHGSFGACPRVVLDLQQELRAEMEREPVHFLARTYSRRIDAARAALAAFLGAEPSDLAFVPNATSGVNAVLHSLRFEPGSELLTTNHEYNASRNALDFAAERDGARVKVAEIPFPIHDPEEALDILLRAVTPKTRLLLIDHVTSPTGLVFPIDRIAPAFQDLGIPILVDGAHAPGMFPLDLKALGVTYYTGNCHKWLCAPKGAAFLWVAPDSGRKIRPIAISHGANTPVGARTRFHLEFDWTGTTDPTPFLCVPEAIRFLESLLPGGMAEVQQRNRTLALEARTLLCKKLQVPESAPASMIGSLAAIALPPDPNPPSLTAFDFDPLQDRLFELDRIEVPIVHWPRPGTRWVRISAQLYNAHDDYIRLARSLLRWL